METCVRCGGTVYGDLGDDEEWLSAASSMCVMKIQGEIRS